MPLQPLLQCKQTLFVAVGGHVNGAALPRDTNPSWDSKRVFIPEPCPGQSVKFPVLVGAYKVLPSCKGRAHFTPPPAMRSPPPTKLLNPLLPCLAPR